jgi:hypothetical protein
VGEDTGHPSSIIIDFIFARREDAPEHVKLL